MKTIGNQKALDLTLECEGWFQATNPVGDSSRKCDLAHVTKYEFNVLIEATNARLSPEGFIMENSRIQKYFDTTYSEVWPVMSCELMAAKASHDLASILVLEEISVVKVTTTIKGAHGAHLSASWENPHLTHA